MAFNKQCSYKRCVCCQLSYKKDLEVLDSIVCISFSILDLDFVVCSGEMVRIF